MSGMKFTSATGEPMELQTESLLHRWDTVMGIELLTLFGQGTVLFVLPEWLHLEQVYISAVNASAEGEFNILSDVTWAYKMEKLQHKFHKGEMSGAVKSAWNALDPSQIAMWRYKSISAAMEERERRDSLGSPVGDAYDATDDFLEHLASRYSWDLENRVTRKPVGYSDE